MSVRVRDSSFMIDGRSGRRVTPWWLAIIMFVVFFLANIMVLGIVGIVWPVEPGSAASQLQEGIGDLVPILLMFLWVGLFERRHIRTVGFRRPGAGVLKLLLGVVIGLVMMSAPILILWATGAYVAADAPQHHDSSGWAALPLVLLLLLTVVVQGSNEEVITRGFLFQSLGQKMPGWLAVVLQAVIFTVVHGVIARPIAFSTIFLFAVFAAFIVLRQGSLWLICGIHAGWNWAMGNVFGIEVSGLPGHTNSIFFLKPAPGAPTWLTGGDFGTEGGLAAVITIAIATFVAFLIYRNHNRTAAAT